MTNSERTFIFALLRLFMRAVDVEPMESVHDWLCFTVTYWGNKNTFYRTVNIFKGFILSKNDI